MTKAPLCFILMPFGNYQDLVVGSAAKSSQGLVCVRLFPYQHLVEETG